MGGKGYKGRKNHVMSVKLSDEEISLIKKYAEVVELEPSTLVRKAALDWCTADHLERRQREEHMRILMDSFMPKFFYAFEGVIIRLRALTEACGGTLDELLIQKLKARKLLDDLDEHGLATAFSEHLESLRGEKWVAWNAD